MTLLETYLEIVRGWRVVFPQERSSMRAIRQALGSLVCLGRRTMIAHHLDQRRRATQLGRRILPAFALSVGTAAAVCSNPQASSPFLHRSLYGSCRR